MRFCLVALALFSIALAPTWSSPSPDVFYLVNGCGGSPVSITYVAGAGEIAQTSAGTPWILSPDDSRVYTLSAQKKTDDSCELSVSIYTATVTIDQFSSIIAGGDNALTLLMKVGTQQRESSSDDAYGVASVSWAPSEGGNAISAALARSPRSARPSAARAARYPAERR